MLCAQAIAYASSGCVLYKLAIILRFLRLYSVARTESLRRARVTVLCHSVLLFAPFIANFSLHPNDLEVFLLLLLLLRENKLTHTRNEVPKRTNANVCSIRRQTSHSLARRKRPCTKQNANTIGNVDCRLTLLNESRKYHINRLM